jgi:hypothetical protein
MTNVSRIISMTALMMAAASQTTLAQTQTDEVLVLTVNLTAVSQGAVTTNLDGTITDVQVTTITSQSIIQVLGAALGDTFSANAKLQVIAPTNYLDGWTFQVQDGTNPAVDVSGFFGHQVGYPSVAGAWISGTTGQPGVTDYSVDLFSMQDQGGYPALSEHFSVSGYTAINSTAKVNKKGVVVGQTDSVSAKVSGTGDNQGTTTVITGTITAKGTGTETVVSVVPTS